MEDKYAFRNIYWIACNSSISGWSSWSCYRQYTHRQPVMDAMQRVRLNLVRQYLMNANSKEIRVVWCVCSGPIGALHRHELRITDVADVVALLGVLAPFKDEVFFEEVTDPMQAINTSKRAWDTSRLTRFTKAFLESGNNDLLNADVLSQGG
ncbi:hypothetical protein K457DRAFT_123546 [Linnemannia elongata AG-77]|uniref:Uncharacterized protein n=1 Tax=Linnemannia elongata AG-77 TaxID=1314771 RepID=A0A197K5X5_9FUNG|nr:hypothetical protein K457DRAFT_123546 [Linnemannia elongata AG-77]